MTRERHATMAGLLLIAALLPGCGGGGGGGSPAASQAPPASDQPDGGLEASRQLKAMQPPKPGGK